MLVIDEKTKNLGTIKYGVPQSFTYKVTNGYHEPVKIQKLIIGCTSCTKAQIDKWDLEREDTATISAVFTPGSTGLQNKKITLLYTVGDIESTVELLIKAQVND